MVAGTSKLEMASHSNFKAPPALSKCSSYETWLKEIKIWQKFTDLKPDKQGPAIFLTLEGRAREAVLELDVDEIGDAKGVENIVQKLNGLYAKDKTQSAYEAYDSFEKFRRPSDMSVSDYINKFERLHSKVKKYGSEMSSDILAYRLLKSANLSEQHEQLARATITKFDYESMKTQLKKIFGDSAEDGATSEFKSDVKVESIFETSEEHDIHYGNTRFNRAPGYKQSHRPGFHSENSNRGKNNQSKYGRSTSANSNTSGARRGRNPFNDRGVVTRCSICDSVNHWMSNCPDKVYYEETIREANIDESHNVTLFQSNLIMEEHMKTFVAESFSSAILDSGATATVAGKTWVDCYIDGLPPNKRSEVVYSCSKNSFKFGSEKVFPSLHKVKIPATIGSQEISIETDVVNTDIPMLLSRNSMKKADTTINFKEDTVSMLGENLKVLITKSGHYALPLNNNDKVLQEAAKEGAKIVLTLQSVNIENKEKIAEKLHSQFAHPSAKRLIKLVESAGKGGDTQLIKEIHNISNNCQICKEYRRPSPRPVVGLPLASEFNEVVAMDLKMFEGKWILHLIDHLSRFSAASFINSKNPEEIIQKIFEIWISVFGPPQRFLSDNGGEFINKQFLDMCEQFNITVMTTAAEAPWSNGLCERHNAVLADMLQKTAAEQRCSLKTALSWSVHAKNSLSNVHGFSPYQLAIGYTPKMPGTLSDKLPALEQCESRTVAEHLSGLAAARKAFIESESSERLKRALRHNVRRSSQNKFFMGDSVFYKRNDSKKWKGPGKVLGQDSQQVLIKHGGIYVRVHPYRVKLEKEDVPDATFEGESACNENAQRIQATEVKESATSHENESSGEDSQPENARNEAVTSDYVDSESESIPVQSMNRNQGNVVDESLNAPEPSQRTPPQTGNRADTKLRKGLHIKYVNKDKQWVEGELLSRAGKATGKYKSHWNVFDKSKDSIEEVNLENTEWNSLGYTECDDVTEETYMCELFLSEVDEQTIKAKEIELDNWKSENVYKEVDDEGQDYISARWVVTPKLVDGCLTTKARLVARGFEEMSIDSRADSPTCMRETLKLVLAMASSKSWSINSIDIKAAFLQGRPINRTVHLKPPKEANSSGKLWLLKKVVYGLADASRVWYLRVVDELSNLGVSVSKYDKALFMWHQCGDVEGVMVVHVDDFFWSGSDKFYNSVIVQLKNVFKISKENHEVFKYIGINIKREKSDLFVDQKSYIDSIQPIATGAISSQTRNETVDDPKILKSFRGLVGQLSWASGITRPDGSFNACYLSSAQSRLTVKEISEANKAVRDLKNNQYQLRYPKLELQSLKIVVHSDASYANLPNGSSQGGFVVFLADDLGRCAPITWGSKKIRRVVRSTLAAETLSAVDAMDSAYLVSKILHELLAQKEDREIKMEMYTDNRSLYDAINTLNLTSDKHLRVDIAALREMHDNGDVSFRWVESSYQLADVLTKRGASKKKLLDVLTTAHYEA